MTFEELQNIQPEDIKKIGSAPLAVKAIAIAIICIVSAFLCYHFIVKDKIERLERTQGEELTLKQDFERKQRKASNLSAYESQLAEMEATFGSMLKSLPDKAEVESLLIEISRAGSANNLEINKFNPTDEEKKEFYAEYPISMELLGTYSEFTGFISSISALQRIVTIHDVQITPVASGESINIALTAKTYRYLSDEAQ